MSIALASMKMIVCGSVNSIENGFSNMGIFQILTKETQLNVDCAKSALRPEES